MKENAQSSKRYQRGFEPGLSRLRVRHSTTEPPRSTTNEPFIMRRAKSQPTRVRGHAWSFVVVRCHLGAIQVLRNAVGGGGVSSFPKNSVTKV